MPKRKGSGADGLRLLSYARVSAVRGREGPGYITETDQLARNRSYTTTYGHRIIEEGVDRDVSGSKMTRPVFDRFLAIIERGEADGLIVAKLDRFARSNVGALGAVEKIEDAGGVLISVAEQLDASTGAGRFMRSILFAAAQWELERIGDQWHAAHVESVRRGVHNARYVPAGYVRGPKAKKHGEPDRQLMPHPVHAETIRQAFIKASEGATNREIADYLNERHLPVMTIRKDAPEGELTSEERPAHWQAARILRLLANRAYLGEARYGSITNTSAHPPLVDERTWILAQHRSRDRRSLRRPNVTATAAPSILSGIARCAACGFAMKAQAARGTSPAIYRCQTVTSHGRCKAPSTIVKKRLEDFVISEFLTAADMLFRGTPKQATNGRRDSLDNEARLAEASYRNALTNVVVRETIGDADHDQMLLALFDAWQSKLIAARDAAAVSESAISLGHSELVTSGEIVERLRDDGENEDLRELLATGIETVLVRPARSKARNLPVADRVRVVWRGEGSHLNLPTRGRRFEANDSLLW